MVQYGGVSTFAVSILVLSSSWTSTPAIADQNDGKGTPTDILTRCVEAIAQVSSMRCDLTILAPTGTESHTDAERDDENRPVHSFVTYWWDRRGFCKVEARDWQPQNVRHLMNGAIYNHYFYTINGQHYRGYSESTRRAKIRSQEHPTRGFMTPLFFLGHEMTDLNENLFEFLQKSGELSSEVVTTAEGYLQISGEYAPINGSYRRTFVVAIDPAQDYLPVQIRTRFKWTGTIDQEITITKTGIVSGVRIPLSGTGVVYAIREIYPDGLTIGDVNAMPKEKYFQDIHPRVRHEEMSLGGLVSVSFDPSHLSFNEIFPQDFFQLAIPDDCEVSDFSHTKVLSKLPAQGQRPTEEFTKQPENSIEVLPTPSSRSTLTNWALLGFANVILFAFWSIRRVFRGYFKRSAAPH